MAVSDHCGDPVCIYCCFLFGQSRTNIGQAMNSTLSGGDVVLLNELSYRFSGPSREDVISFKLNGSEDTHSYIRRVIGLPGETIQIIDGMIYINGSVYLETQGFHRWKMPEWQHRRSHLVKMNILCLVITAIRVKTAVCRYGKCKAGRY